MDELAHVTNNAPVSRALASHVSFPSRPQPLAPAPARIRVALATTELAVGGAERCLANLAARMDREKFEPVVYSLAPPPEASRAELLDLLQQHHVDVRFVDARSARQFLSATGRLTAMLRQQAPHVLQTFLFHANVVGTIAGRRAGVPAIVTGCRVADPRRWRAAVERCLVGRIDRIVCVSQSVAEHQRTWARLPAEKLFVIPNGIDSGASQIQPADLAPLGIGPERRVIVFVGRLHQQKGVDWLLDLAPELLAALPEHDLLLVGDGPLRPLAEQLAASPVADGRVHVAGHRPDVPAILRRCDLLVLPSRWEGLPNAVLEAMAAGLPVVATRVEGIAELLGDALDAQTVAGLDRESFVHRVIALASDSRVARATGAANQQRVREHFTLETMVRRYESLYTTLVWPEG